MTDTDRTAAIRLAKDAGVFIPVRYRDGKTEPVSEPFERFRQLCRAELLAEQAAKPSFFGELGKAVVDFAKPADGCAHCNSPLFCATKCGSCGKSFEEGSPLPEEVARTILGLNTFTRYTCDLQSMIEQQEISLLRSLAAENAELKDKNIALAREAYTWSKTLESVLKERDALQRQIDEARLSTDLLI